MHTNGAESYAGGSLVTGRANLSVQEEADFVYLMEATKQGAEEYI
jgi:hypothetical protein